jgi:uncharacterized phiE125 gp8 family phage protein
LLNQARFFPKRERASRLVARVKNQRKTWMAVLIPVSSTWTAMTVVVSAPIFPLTKDHLMTPLLMTGPVIEPISLTEMKTYLRVDTNDDDGLINAFITAARLLIEASSRRVFISQTWRLVLDQWPKDGFIRVPVSPLIQIVAARVFNASGIASTVALSSLEANSLSDPPQIAIVGPVMVTGRARSGVEIDISCGYGSAIGNIPEPLRQAIRLLVARWYDNRGDIMHPHAATLPPDIAALVAPYRRMRV